MFKRKVTPAYDILPSIDHQLHFEFSKKDIMGKKLLDVGCWTGQYITLARSIACCTGIDIEEKAILFAKKQYPKVKFYVGSVLNLPFENGSFDVITFWEIIEHLPRGTEPKALSEIGRVLKAGGILFLSTPSNHPISILSDPAFFLKQHRHYSLDNLRWLLKNAGFKIEKAHLRGGIFYILYFWAQMFFKHVLKRATPELKLLKTKAERDLKSGGFSQISIKARLKNGRKK